jgi:hypothetical protein
MASALFFLPSSLCVNADVSWSRSGLALQVGDVFLKNAYFSIDLTNNTISLAKLV